LKAAKLQYEIKTKETPKKRNFSEVFFYADGGGVVWWEVLRKRDFDFDGGVCTQRFGA
jgi:hypothetical protein